MRASKIHRLGVDTARERQRTNPKEQVFCGGQFVSLSPRLALLGKCESFSFSFFEFFFYFLDYLFFIST